jgi:hypothetical protein
LFEVFLCDLFSFGVACLSDSAEFQFAGIVEQDAFFFDIGKEVSAFF